MRNFAKDLVEEHLEQLISFLHSKITFERIIELSDFKIKDKSELEEIPTNRMGKSLIPCSYESIYVGAETQSWAYKIIITDSTLYIYYLSFVCGKKSVKLFNYTSLRVLNEEWQVFLASIFKEDYIEFVKDYRMKEYNRIREQNNEMLRKHRKETERIIQSLRTSNYT